METAPNKTNQTELPPEIAQAAQRIDEVLASLDRSREEHNVLAGSLRTIVSKILELMEQAAPSSNQAPAKPSK